MMGEPARKVATYQDVLNAPDHQVAEIFDGELHLSPRPAPRHAYASMMINMDMAPLMSRRRRGGSNGGWLILPEPELHLRVDIIVPDLAGWRSDRMPRLPREPYFSLAPDWVCEVVSPGTARIDRTTKKAKYARHRVQYLWLVDPVGQTLEVYQLAGDLWREVAVYGGSDRVKVPPFEELELDLAGWWEEAEDQESELDSGMQIEEFQEAWPVFLATRSGEWYTPTLEAEQILANLCEKGFLKRRRRAGSGDSDSSYEYQGSDALMAIVARLERESSEK